MVLGTCTGSSPRSGPGSRPDPDSLSCAPQAHGVYNALFWWNNLLTPILPALCIASVTSLLGVASLFVIGSVILMFVFFGRKKK